VTSVRSAADLPVSSRRLWFGVLAAPAAWVVAELAGYALVARGCSAGRLGPAAYAMPRSFPIFVGLTIACVLVAVAGLLVARNSSRRIAGAVEDRPVTAELAASRRARFLAGSGVLVSALFLLGVVLLGVLPPLLQPCSEVH